VHRPTLRGRAKRTTPSKKYFAAPPWREPLVLTAAATGVLLVVLVALALSPLLRVRNVMWTGSLRPSDSDCAAVEQALLGTPLWFASEADLRARAKLDNKLATLTLRRHLPATLEVTMRGRRAVARLESGDAIDARGRVLAPEHALAGLPRLDGFELAEGGKVIERRDLLAAILPLFELPTLAPSRIALRDEGLELVLADSGAQVRLDSERVTSQLLKLRVFEESLGGEPLPGGIDLRFQDQVVVRDTGGRNARRAR
jgi:cell division septal protein FtsQ